MREKNRLFHRENPPRLIGATAETLYFSCYSLKNNFNIPPGLLSLREKITNPEPPSGGTLSPKIKPRAEAWPWLFDYERWEQGAEGMQRRPGQIAFEVLPRGRSHFWLVLKNDDMEIQTVRHFSAIYPTVYIQIRARLIWAVGYPNALRYCVDVAEKIFGRFINTALSRVDFTVDIENWEPTENYFRSRIVGRPVKSEKHIDHDISITGAYYVKTKFTGIRIGKGKPMLVRFYDKTEEILVNGTKTWFYEVWKKNGWSGKGRVWRVEFQCRRKVLAAFGFGDSVDSLDKFAGMFRYLTIDWIRLCIPNRTQKQRTRWKTAPIWKLVQGANFGNGGDVTRAAQKIPERKQLMDQFHGVATTIAARYGVTTDAGLRKFIRYILLTELTPDHIKKMQKKKALYDMLSLVKAESLKNGLDLRRQDRK